MKNLIQVCALLILTVFCVSCKSQSKADLPKQKEGTSLIELTSPLVPNSITRTIKQDKEGNIWLASFEGILKYDGSTFTNVSEEASLSRFFSVLEDKKGHLWFASIGSGVYWYNGSTFQNFTIEEGLGSDQVTHIYEDRKGDVWFGTEGGASCYNGKKIKNYTTANGLPNNDVNAIVEDKTGKYWLGTRGQACTFDGNTFTRILKNDGSPFYNVRSIILDQNGNIWLGGNDGLWRFDGKEFTRYSKNFIGYIYEDRAGNIWTSSDSKTTAGWTLSRYNRVTLDDHAAKPIEVKKGEGMFFGILEAKDGSIWVGKLDGVYRYDGQTFDDFKE